MSDAIVDMRHHQRCAGVRLRKASFTVRVRVMFFIKSNFVQDFDNS